MDGNRFDDITRTLATGANRRGFLKGLTGALAGLVGLSATKDVDAVCSPGGWYCSRNSDCCTGLCGTASGTSRRRTCCTANPDSVTCAGITCGAVVNNCGQTITCGACSGCQSCNGISCVDDSSLCTGGFDCIGGVCQCNEDTDCDNHPTDPCQVGACSVGSCGYKSAADGTSCNDGNACTQTDTCSVGVCTGSNPVICTASDQCHDIGACDTTTGACSDPVKADGAVCNDGNGCTGPDTCSAGVCAGPVNVTCTALNACHIAGTCDTATGQCSNPNGPDGVTCDDGNLCTTGTTCTAGACGGGTPVVCTPSSECLEIGACVAATGCPQETPKSQGSTCSGGVCDGAGACIQCLVDDDCDVDGTYCAANGTCTSGCNDNEDCGAASGLPYCTGNAKTPGICVICLDDTHCADHATNACAIGACMADNTCDFKPARDDAEGTVIVCREAVNACDVSEYCPVNSTTCPTDAKAPLDTPCATCDRCDGNGACIPYTGAPQTNECGTDETCENGACVADCLAGGQTCVANNDCCSGSCDTSAGRPNCRPACTTTADCDGLPNTVGTSFDDGCVVCTNGACYPDNNNGDCETDGGDPNGWCYADGACQECIPTGTCEVDNQCCSGHCSAANQCVECEADVDCDEGEACCGNVCKSALGETCLVGTECCSTFCVDGVCCDDACNTTCVACTNAKTGLTNGDCSPVTAQTDPDNECSGTTPVCDGAAACVCASNSTSCANDTECCSGRCLGGVCAAKLANGQGCVDGGDCTSGNCVGGVCCDTACSGVNQTCATGTCGCAANYVDCDTSAALNCQQCCGASGANDNNCVNWITNWDDDCATCSSNICVSDNADGDCGTNGYCASGACQACKANTLSCTHNNQCCTGRCAGPSGSQTCQATLADGQVCEETSDCTAGSCINFVIGQPSYCDCVPTGGQCSGSSESNCDNDCCNGDTTFYDGVSDTGTCS